MDKRKFVKLYKELCKEDITLETATKNIEDFLRIWEKALLIDGQVKLMEKGVFEIVEKKPKKIANPQTKEIIEIYPKKNIRLRVSKHVNIN